MFDSLRVAMPIKLRQGYISKPFKTIMAYGPQNEKKPFFNVELSESSHYTLNRFLEALRLCHFDDAMSYISKNYLDRVDISEISMAFINDNKLCSRNIIKESFDDGPKNCAAGTVLMVDSDEGKTRIFNIHMLNEPDKYGKWKIYCIEQE